MVKATVKMQWRKRKRNTLPVIVAVIVVVRNTRDSPPPTKNDPLQWGQRCRRVQMWGPVRSKPNLFPSC